MRVRVLVLISICFAYNSAFSAVDPTLPEDTIHILVVKEDGVSQSVIDENLENIMWAWQFSDFAGGEGGAPVTLTIINPSTPLILIVSPDGDGIENQASVAAQVSIPAPEVSLRDAFAADVVLAFVDSIDGPPPEPGQPPLVSCGFAFSPLWSGPTAQFQVTPGTIPPVDLRGQNQYYVAVVATESPCNYSLFDVDTAAHELGHILGAGHYEDDPSNPSDPTQTGLFPNSRSDTKIANYYWTYLRSRTVMGSDADSVCQSGPTCANAVVFSDRSSFWNNPNRRNTDAIDQTALSVAYYRTGVPEIGVAESCFDGYDNDGDGQEDGMDPDCNSTLTEAPPPPPPPANCDSLSKPYNLMAFLVAQCNVINGITWSHYRVFYEHHCFPESVDNFEVWKEIPVGSGYIFGWRTFLNSADALIEGGPGRIKVKACGSAGCSDLSDQSVLLVDQC